MVSISFFFFKLLVEFFMFSLFYFFIYLFDKDLFSICYMLGIFFGIGDIVVDKIKFLWL